MDAVEEHTKAQKAVIKFRSHAASCHDCVMAFDENFLIPDPTELCPYGLSFYDDADKAWKAEAPEDMVWPQARK